jgi:hypothetical protein
VTLTTPIRQVPRCLTIDWSHAFRRPTFIG